MRVLEAAKELDVSSEALINLLREMEVPVASSSATVADEHVARVRTVLERERRLGHASGKAAIEAALEDQQSSAPRGRRRRRSKEDMPPVPAAPEPAEAGVLASSASESPAEPEAVEEPARARPDEPVPAEPEPAPLASARPRPAASSAPTPAREGQQLSRVRVQAEGFTADGRRQRPDRKRKKKRSRVDQGAVQQNIRRTMAAIESGGKKRRKSQSTGLTAQERRELEQEEERQEEATTVRVNEFLTVAELAELIEATPTEIVSSAFKNLGLMVTINQRLDFDQIEMLLDEFGYRAVREQAFSAAAEIEVEEDRAEDLSPRPPVVTVMGHVDHGKTSLLDHIRKENVIAGEAGGITQHIGAYHLGLDDARSLTFLDTPGHAAFTAMRARGAEVTDVVILVVAADDSVMPQTIEAISHAKNAGVPVVVAVNKVDLPDADPARVKQDLLQHEVILEEFGGEVMSADVSAKTGAGLGDLLDKVLLQAELLELKANPGRDALGVVIESQLDVGKGPVATVLVTNGTLRPGDYVICGLYNGRVRALLDERGRPVAEAGPSIPVQLLGLSGVPQAGDQLIRMDAVRAAEVAQTRQRLEREKRMRIKGRGVKLGDLSAMLARGETTQLNILIKGDVDGSVQALSDSLEQLSTDEVAVDVIHRGVGAINESDVLLASTAGAIVIGFHVRPTAEARQTSEREQVDIRLYSVIYEAVEEIRAAMEGLLAPGEKEVLLGVAEVREVFKIPRAGTIAGCMVTEGEVRRRGLVRVIRDEVQIYQGELDSLKRFKDDVREVREGFECGLHVADFNDVKVGDVIECFRVEEVVRTLATAAAE